MTENKETDANICPAAAVTAMDETSTVAAQIEISNMDKSADSCKEKAKKSKAPLESGGQEGGTSLSGVGKKRKRRRRRGGTSKRRQWKPYMQLSFEERVKLAEREERRAEETRKQRFRNGIPVAPYNTTQFLLQDRGARTEHQRDEEREVEEIVNHVLHQDTGPHPHGRHHHRSNEHDHGSAMDAAAGNSDVPASSSSNADAVTSISGRISGTSPSKASTDAAMLSPSGSSAYSAGSSSSDEGGQNGSAVWAGDEDYLEREFSKDYSTYRTEQLAAMDKSDLIRDYQALERQLEEAQVELEEVKARLTRTEEENVRLRSAEVQPVVSLIPPPSSTDSHPTAAVTAELVAGVVFNGH